MRSLVRIDPDQPGLGASDQYGDRWLELVPEPEPEPTIWTLKIFSLSMSNHDWPAEGLGGVSSWAETNLPGSSQLTAVQPAPTTHTLSGSEPTQNTHDNLRLSCLFVYPLIYLFFF